LTAKVTTGIDGVHTFYFDPIASTKPGAIQIGSFMLLQKVTPAGNAKVYGPIPILCHLGTIESNPDLVQASGVSVEII